MDASVHGVGSLLEKGEAREIREVERQEHGEQMKGRQGHGDLVLCGLADRGGGEAQLRRAGQGASAPAICGRVMELGSGRAREELAPTSFPVTGRIFGWLRVMGIEEGHGGALVGGLDQGGSR